MNFFKPVLYFLFIVIAFTACRTTKVNPAYTPVSDDSAYVKPVSIIAVPVQLDYKTLEKTIHYQLSPVLYEDLSYDNNNTDDLMIRITRKDTIRVDGQGNKLRLQAPLHLWIKYRFRKKILGINLEEQIEKDLDVFTIIQSQLSVNSKWQLTANTQTSIDTRLLPAINMPGFVIDLNNLLTPVIRAQEKKVSKLIDEGLPKWVDLRTLVNKQWMALQNPLSLDTAYKAWLIVQPDMITMSDITFAPDHAKFGFNFLLSGEIRTSEGIPYVSKKMLPDLQRTQGINNGFNIIMPVRLLYKQLTQNLNAQLANKLYTFENNKHQIFIEQVLVFPDKGKLGVAVDFHGLSETGVMKKKLKGKLILTCEPKYDASTKTLRFQHLEYSVATKDILLKTASWLLQGKEFKQNLEQKLVLPLGNQLNQLRELAGKAINTQPAKDIYLQGDVTAVDIDDIRLLNESCIVYLRAKGKVHLFFRQ